jgi:hypothetical protein
MWKFVEERAVGRLSNCSGCCCILSLPLLIYLTTTPKKREHTPQKPGKLQKQKAKFFILGYGDTQIREKPTGRIRLETTHTKHHIRHNPHYGNSLILG